jgi:osomolarity two-component system sensor histidine kinase TcsA
VNLLDANILQKLLLLVDDNPVNQKVMLKTLQKLGFTSIEVAADGREGVETYQKGNHDLVIMDISMPVLDGVGATQEIRNSGSHVPIIAMTANALKGDADAFIAAGMSDYIAKPVDRKLLIALLAKWLS